MLSWILRWTSLFMPKRMDTSISEITKMIINLEHCNSVGWDNMPTTIIKYTVNILALILFNLINYSFAMGSSQSLSKEIIYCPYLISSNIALIAPNKDIYLMFDVTNYRPISILPVISKVYEKEFYPSLNNTFSENNLSSSQLILRSCMQMKAPDTRY